MGANNNSKQEVIEHKHGPTYGATLDLHNVVILCYSDTRGQIFQGCASKTKLIPVISPNY